MKKIELLSSGKAKSLYTTENSDQLIMEYRDDTSAFDGKKIEKLAGKGTVNNRFNAHVMQQIEKSGIPTHFIDEVSENESLVRKLEMVPIECVVRNITAGSICKRLGLEEGMELNPPTFEFFYKDDELGDPMVNEFHIISFNWGTEEDIEEMRELTFKVNDVLKKMFADGGLLLVDFKLEFGRQDGKMYLGDEMTPDGCRVWAVSYTHLTLPTTSTV